MNGGYGEGRTTGKDSKKKLHGKFKGTVVTNIDPEQMGRLLVQVPDVLGNDPCIWAEPAAPLAGSGMGLYFVPPMNSGVWVEFENGDPDSAIWTGCWRGSLADVPPLAQAAPPAVPPIVLGTQGQNSIMVSDVPGPEGGILLMTNSGAGISISQAGVIISDGKGGMVTISQGTVIVNSGALVIK